MDCTPSTSARSAICFQKRSSPISARSTLPACRSGVRSVQARPQRSWPSWCPAYAFSTRDSWKAGRSSVPCTYAGARRRQHGAANRRLLARGISRISRHGNPRSGPRPVRIGDEHDIRRPLPVAGASVIEVDGGTNIRDLASQYGIELPGDAGFETLAGFLLFERGNNDNCWRDVIAVRSMMSPTEQPRERSWAGFWRPCRIGPIALRNSG